MISITIMKKKQLAIVSGIHILLLNYLFVSGFNLDTKYPIVYRDMAINTPGRPSYFGFTVLLNGPNSWILIGAPRANSSYLEDVKEPGVVFKCPYKKPCNEMQLDLKGNEEPEAGERNVIKDLKDYAWIGGSMGCEPGKKGRVVMCGPRWKNQFYLEKRQEYHMTGICYWMYADESDEPADRLTPTISNNEYNEHITFSPPTHKKHKVYDYGMSQAGMGIHFVPGNKDIGMLLGAPGLLNWRGGVVEYPNGGELHAVGGREKRSTEAKFFSEPKIVNPYYADDVNDFDLFGYQVSSGHFFSKSESLYVASSPRGAMYRGYVLIFKFPNVVLDNSKWIRYDKKQGQEPGEYFGYSLAVGDITGDGLDDLIVGAPMYSNGGQKQDAGRIHIFLGSLLTTLQVPKSGSLIEGNHAGARFGTAVVSLKDIDQDNYDDIAVGAPYEDEHRGAVYIYNGSPQGLKPKYSQRIGAAEIDLTLRGFGVSLSPTADIDNNHYYDLASGAYLSGHAVLLRAYPVVRLGLSVEATVSNLLVNITTFTVTVCQSYRGSNAPPSINVTRTLKIDERYKRVRFNRGHVKLVVKVTEKSCEDVIVSIKSGEDNLEAVEITVSQDLEKVDGEKSVLWINGSSVSTDADKFCAHCPVVQEAGSLKETSMSIPYARECNPCRSNLHLSCGLYEVDTHKSLRGFYVIGSGNIIRLVMNVTNDNQTAYSSRVTVDLPTYVNMASLPEDCQEIQGQGASLSIVCEFKKPIRQTDAVVSNMTLDLDMSSVDRLVDEMTGTAPDIVFKIRANSSSIELDGHDNYCRPTLTLKTEADFTIVGKSREEIYPYTKKKDDISESTSVQFIQAYQAKKIGESPVKEALIKFAVPMEWRPRQGEVIRFLTMYRPEPKLNKQPVKCESDEIDFITHNQEDKSMNDIDIQEIPENLFRSKRSLKETDTKDSGVKSKQPVHHHPSQQTDEGDINVTSQSPTHQDPSKQTDLDMKSKHLTHQYPSNRTLYLNCSTEEVMCSTITCTYTQFRAKSTEVELKMIINVTMLEPLLKNKDIISLSTQGQVEIKNPPNMQHDEVYGPNEAIVPSIFIGSVPEETVEIWIIVLSIVAGILLFLLLVTGLVKAGFFQRKKKEELQALKNADDEFETSPGAMQQLEEEDCE